MLVNSFNPTNSVSKYISQKKTTQTDLTTAENLLGKKIDQVLNKLQSHAQKRNIDILFITTGIRNKSGEVVEINIDNGNKVAESLIKITNHNTTAKGRAITDEIYILNKKLNKYIEQTDILNNKKYIAHKSLDMLINYVNSTPDFINQVGIFRVPGNHTEVDKLLKIMDRNDFDRIEKYLKKKPDTNTICSVIKKKFALQLSNKDKLNIINLAKEHKTHNKETQGKDNFLWKNKLPQPLNQLLPLLSSINRHNDNNNSSSSKMTASNLAIVFSPNILNVDNAPLKDITQELVNMELINELLIDAIKTTPPLVPSRNNKPSINK
ncbi:TPA: RhoGAP domain-containing protein [Yersinia enterocolitica]